MSRSVLTQLGAAAFMLAGVAFITCSRIPAASSVGDTIQLVVIALLPIVYLAGPGVVLGLRVGDSWSKRYASLVLFAARAYSAPRPCTSSERSSKRYGERR